MNEKMIRKHLRRKFNPVGWTLVVYYLIMNVTVIATLVVDLVASIFSEIAKNPELIEGDLNAIMNTVMESAMDNAWGYLLASAVGLFILLCWKGIPFWKQEIWAKGRPMKPGDFFRILCVFLGIQIVTSILCTVLEFLLNRVGLSMMSVLESTGGSSDSLSMYIYASICAPIVEELLFRGYIQRTLRPYGKKFAIFCSALLFGLYHGNLIQTPFAFMVGLVLGYVMEEYGIAWAMVLHMVNNMLVADMLTRLTSGLPELLAMGIQSLVLVGFGIAAVVVLIVKRREVAAYLRRERMNKLCLQAFFSNAGVITMTVLMLLSIVMLITPI